jgi:hypothetical protein
LTAATAHEIHKPASFTRVRLLRANSSQIVPDFTALMTLTTSFVMIIAINLLVANVAEKLSAFRIDAGQQVIIASFGVNCSATGATSTKFNVDVWIEFISKVFLYHFISN